MQSAIDKIDLLREAFTHVKKSHPYKMDAVVILPEHLHCILTLPDGDSDFSTRWGLIKAYFSRQIANNERISESRMKRGERGLWQRRFWEHLIRDETDYQQHIDYIHWNPVKHGWVESVKDWPHSSFHRYVEKGIYPSEWASADDNDGDMDLYVANDKVMNLLYNNNGKAVFSEEALFSGVGYNENGRAEAGMGVDFGDINQDGWLDLFVTNFSGESNTLYLNDQNGSFTDKTFSFGLGQPSLDLLGFGTKFVDFNLDGWLDIFIVNGHVIDNIALFNKDYTPLEVRSSSKDARIKEYLFNENFNKVIKRLSVKV